MSQPTPPPDPGSNQQNQPVPPPDASPRNADSRNIVLTGFMGVGKTTVGRILARKLRRGFLDTDAIITERHGPITEIFARDGEQGFRDIERGVAAELGRQRGLVVATGGRLMLDPANITSLNRTGHVFALAATAAQVWSRVNQGKGIAKRPLLAGPDPLGTITELLAERGPMYHRFPQVAAGVRKADAVAAEIIELHERGQTVLVSADGKRRAIIGVNLLAHLDQITPPNTDAPPSSPRIADPQTHDRLAPLIGTFPSAERVLVGDQAAWIRAAQAAPDTPPPTVHCLTGTPALATIAAGEDPHSPDADLTVIDLATFQPELPDHHALRAAWDSAVSTFTTAGWTSPETAA